MICLLKSSCTRSLNVVFSETLGFSCFLFAKGKNSWRSLAWIKRKCSYFFPLESLTDMYVHKFVLRKFTCIINVAMPSSWFYRFCRCPVPTPWLTSSTPCSLYDTLTHTNTLTESLAKTKKTLKITLTGLILVFPRTKFFYTSILAHPKFTIYIKIRAKIFCI